MTIKDIYNILNPNDHPILEYNHVFKRDDFNYKYGYQDIGELLINSYPDIIKFDKNDPDYILLKEYLRMEDYLFCSNVYTNILRCINYKSDNPNKITKIEWVNVHSLSNLDYKFNPVLNIRFYNGFYITLENLTPHNDIDHYSQRLYNLIKKLYYVSPEECKESKIKRYMYYQSIRNEIVDTVCHNLEYMLMLYLTRILLNNEF